MRLGCRAVAFTNALCPLAKLAARVVNAMAFLKVPWTLKAAPIVPNMQQRVVLNTTESMRDFNDSHIGTLVKKRIEEELGQQNFRTFPCRMVECLLKAMALKAMAFKRSSTIRHFLVVMSNNFQNLTHLLVRYFTCPTLGISNNIG